MPFERDPGVREDPRYCSLCFREGKFCYEGEWRGFSQAAYRGMRERGINPVIAKFLAWMTRFAPRWKGK